MTTEQAELILKCLQVIAFMASWFSVLATVALVVWLFGGGRG